MSDQYQYLLARQAKALSETMAFLRERLTERATLDCIERDWQEGIDAIRALAAERSDMSHLMASKLARITELEAERDRLREQLRQHNIVLSDVYAQQRQRVSELEQERDRLREQVTMLTAKLPKNPRKRGTCQGCGKEMSTWKDGKVRTHLGPDRKHDCPGSRQLSCEALGLADTTKQGEQ